MGEEPYTSSATEAPPPPELEPDSKLKTEVVTYSKAVQTDGLDFQPETPEGSVASDNEDAPGTTRSNKRSSRRDKERDEEILQKLRKEIEEELRATNQEEDNDNSAAQARLRYPLRTLDDDELKAVTSSDDFLDFVERSSKVIERALDEDYDVLADYELGGIDGNLQEDEESGKKKRGMTEVSHFWDERWSKNRIISDLSFSPKVGLSDQLSRFDANFYSSSPNCCWHHTLKIPPLLTSLMAWSRSGTNTCNLAQNMSFTPPPTS